MMDEAASRYARELLEAINAAIAQSPEVQRCRAQARAAGFELQVTFEAKGRPMTGASQHEVRILSAHRGAAAPKTYVMTAADRRFLRSLRIAADETPEPVE